MASEGKLTLEKLQEQIRDYVDERMWNKYHKPKDLAISIAIESAELLETFQWKSDPIENGRIDNQLRNRIGEETADVMIYCICMANAIDIDLSITLPGKIEKNRKKYPVRKVRRAKDWDEVIRARSSRKSGDD